MLGPSDTLGFLACPVLSSVSAHGLQDEIHEIGAGLGNRKLKMMRHDSVQAQCAEFET